MKPNLVLIQPPHVDCDSIIDRFCEALCDTHYVYLFRPITTFREDSPAGVRILNYTPDRLPGFGMVETVIVVDCAEAAERLKATYPHAHHSFWNLVEGGESPFALVPTLSDRIIQGDFGQAASLPLAKAM